MGGGSLGRYEHFKVQINAQAFVLSILLCVVIFCFKLYYLLIWRLEKMSDIEFLVI